MTAKLGVNFLRPHVSFPYITHAYTDARTSCMDKQMLMHPRMHIRTHLHTYVHARTHTHAHTHTRTRTYTLSLLKHFGPYARVACCPSTIRDPPPPHTPTHTQQPHTHTHTEYSLIHLLVHMQKWLVAHVQGARTYTQMHTHTHTTDTHDTFVHTFWSTCRSGLLPIYKAPMSCRAGISKGKLHGRASRQMFIISFL